MNYITLLHKLYVTAWIHYLRDDFIMRKAYRQAATTTTRWGGGRALSLIISLSFYPFPLPDIIEKLSLALHMFLNFNINRIFIQQVCMKIVEISVLPCPDNEMI